MAAGLAFRRAEAADLADIARLKRCMFEEAGHASLLAEDAEAQVLTYYQILHTQGQAAHFLALAEGRIVAALRNL